MRFSGEYDNINQGSFLILSTDGGLDRVDTIFLREGEFDYQCKLADEATYCIVYPNNAQLVLWAHSGDHIKVKGDVQDLWRVKVSGNEDNELYTQFRQENEAGDTAALRQSAALFIRQYPMSRVSPHLLCQYFVKPDDVPLDSTEALYRVLLDAQPQDPYIASLGGLIQQRYALRKENKMPAFDLLTDDSVHHTLNSFKGTDFVLYFWAGWQGSSGYLHRELSYLRDERKAKQEGGEKLKDIKLLGYSLDIDSLAFQINKPDKSLNVPTYCDMQGFSGQLINLLGVRTIPLFVVVDANGKIRLVCKDVKDVRKCFE